MPDRRRRGQAGAAGRRAPGTGHPVDSGRERRRGGGGAGVVPEVVLRVVPEVVPGVVPGVVLRVVPGVVRRRIATDGDDPAA